MNKVYVIRYLSGEYNGKDISGNFSVGVDERYPAIPKGFDVERLCSLSPDEAEALAVKLINQAFICRAENEGKFGAGSPDTIQLAFPEYWKVKNQYEQASTKIEPVFKKED